MKPMGERGSKMWDLFIWLWIGPHWTHRLLRPGWSECKSLMRKEDNQPCALKIQFTFTESTNYVLGFGVTERKNVITIYWKPVRKPRLQFSVVRIVMIVIIPEPIGLASSGSEITTDPIRVSLRAFCWNESLFSCSGWRSVDKRHGALGPCCCQIRNCSKTEKSNRRRKNCRRRELELSPSDRVTPWIKLCLKPTFLLSSPFI